jgi:ADP-ribose pyrophosphatase
MKIPDDAKKVFKGIIFDVYHWQQQMFDGTFQTFEALKRSNTIEIIATTGEKIYMTHQSQPNKHDFYSLLGGRGEEGEDPLVTAKRELLEEAGLESEDWELFKVFQPMHKIDWKIYTFIARNCRKLQDQKLDAGEKIKVLELSFDEFISMVLSDNYWGNELVLEILKRKDKNTLNELKAKFFK